MTKEQRKVGTALAAICGHEVRVEIVTFLSREEGNEGVSANMLHKIGVAPLQNVSYHMRQLRDAKAIRKARSRPVRGAIETFYVLTDEGRGAYHALTHVRPITEEEAHAAQAREKMDLGV